MCLCRLGNIQIHSDICPNTHMKICVPIWIPNYFSFQCSNVLYKVLLLDHTPRKNPYIRPIAVQLLRAMGVARRNGSLMYNCAGVPHFAEDSIPLVWHLQNFQDPINVHAWWQKLLCVFYLSFVIVLITFIVLLVLSSSLKHFVVLTDNEFAQLLSELFQDYSISIGKIA